MIFAVGLTWLGSTLLRRTHSYVVLNLPSKEGGSTEDCAIVRGIWFVHKDVLSLQPWPLCRAVLTGGNCSLQGHLLDTGPWHPYWLNCSAQRSYNCRTTVDWEVRQSRCVWRWSLFMATRTYLWRQEKSRFWQHHLSLDMSGWFRWGEWYYEKDGAPHGAQNRRRFLRDFVDANNLFGAEFTGPKVHLVWGRKWCHCIGKRLDKCLRSKLGDQQTPVWITFDGLGTIKLDNWQQDLTFKRFTLDHLPLG